MQISIISLTRNTHTPPINWTVMNSHYTLQHTYTVKKKCILLDFVYLLGYLAQQTTWLRNILCPYDSDESRDPRSRAFILWPWILWPYLCRLMRGNIRYVFLLLQNVVLLDQRYYHFDKQYSNFSVVFLSLHFFHIWILKNILMLCLIVYL